MPRSVLITGSTGTVSRALTAELTKAGIRPRLMVRARSEVASLKDTGLETVVGDLDDRRTLEAAFDGVSDVWLLTPNSPRAPENHTNAVWAAQRFGVERIVRLSAVGAAHDAPTLSGRLHALSESELQASDLNWTVLRPLWFMQNLFNEAASVRDNARIALDMGEAKLGMVDVRDIAAVAASILQAPPDEHHGQAYTLTGPEPLDFNQVANALSRTLAKEVTYEAIPPSQRRGTLLEFGLDPWLVGMLEDYSHAYADGWGDYVTTAVRDITGNPPRTLADFLDDHTSLFR